MTQNWRLRLVVVAGLSGILQAQNISTIAGVGTPGVSGDLSPAVNAQLNAPSALALDGTGNLYIADTQNDRVRKVAADGTISTFAGTVRGYLGDGGFANRAQLFLPQGVAVDSVGTVYIADTGNNRIRRVSNPDGIITTIAGTGSNVFGGDGGPAVNAGLVNPASLAIDSAGNVYIGETGRVRKITASTGVINTIAGTGTVGFSGDGGAATSAMLGAVTGLAVDSAGNVYIADSANARIRKITGTNITTIAGAGTAGFGGDSGLATKAQLNNPMSIALDSSGNLYIADTANNRIRKVTADGNIATVAGNGTPGFSGDGAAATGAMLQAPAGVAVDAAGSIYISDTGNFRIRKVTGTSVGLHRVGALAQVASGGGWKTTISLSNTTASQATVRVVFWASDGSAMNLPLTVTQQGTPQTTTATSLDQTLNANATVVIETEAQTSNTAVGWADVLSTGTVTGYAIFRQHGQGGDSEGTVFLDKRLQPSLILPFDNTGGFATGVAVANLSAKQAGCSIIIWDAGGAQIGTQSLSLPGNGHASFAAADQLPATTGKRGFLELQGTAAEGITAVGLRFSPGGTFTSIPELSR